MSRRRGPGHCLKTLRQGRVRGGGGASASAGPSMRKGICPWQVNVGGTYGLRSRPADCRGAAAPGVSVSARSTPSRRPSPTRLHMPVTWPAAPWAAMAGTPLGDAAGWPRRRSAGRMKGLRSKLCGTCSPIVAGSSPVALRNTPTESGTGVSSGSLICTRTLGISTLAWCLLHAEQKKNGACCFWSRRPLRAG